MRTRLKTRYQFSLPSWVTVLTAHGRGSQSHARKGQRGYSCACIWVQDGGEWLASSRFRSTPGKRGPSAGWVSSRAGLDAVLTSLRTHRESIRNPAFPAYHNLVTIRAKVHCRWKDSTVVDPREQLLVRRLIKIPYLWANIAEKTCGFVVIASVTFHW